MICLMEATLRFLVGLLLQSEFLVIEEFDKPVLGKHHVNQSHQNHHHVCDSIRVPDLSVEDDGSYRLDNEGHVKQSETDADEIARNLPTDG